MIDKKIDNENDRKCVKNVYHNNLLDISFFMIIFWLSSKWK